VPVEEVGQGEVDRRETGRYNQSSPPPGFRSELHDYLAMLWREPIRWGLREGAMAMPATRYAKSGDVHMAYQVFGSGPIDLILIPGFFTLLAQGERYCR
jgi:hypothetical protein